MSMTARVLLGLALGAAIGLGLAIWFPGIAPDAAAVVQPFGRLWLNALQMTVVPLVAALVVLGVNAASDAAASGRTARMAIVVFLVLLTLAATYVAFAAPAFLSLLPRDEAAVTAFRAALQPAEVAQAPGGFGAALAAIIPSNAIAAAASNAMLPLVVFALFFGFALTRIDAARKARMLEFVQSVADVMIVIVRWVLWAAPLGVFALVLAVCAQVGLNMLGALGGYILMQCTLYASVTLMLYLVARAAGGEPIRRFAAAIAPAQTIAASTQSSLASLPAMIESARTRLGYPLHVTSLVLPMAVSLFRITSPMQYLGVAAFVAWLYGIDVSAAQWATGIALSVIISMGSVGLPGQVSFMATNMPVVQAMSLPVEPLGVLLAVDTIPDVFSTVGNVTADLTATSVVARRDGPDAQAGAAGLASDGGPGDDRRS
jgi:proton glutamate symport protein